MSARPSRLSGFVSALLLILAGAALPLGAQAPLKVTTPTEALGFEVGADYRMASYTQLENWWKKLAVESPRMKLVDIGQTAEGRSQYMAVISSPDNLAKLDRYREIAARLAHAEGLTDEQARALAQEGKAVVWIDGGLHASETVGSQQLMLMVYEMVSQTDRETLRFLDDVILLAVQANPDGQEFVADWYMRKPDEKARSILDLPKLYNKYIGHDNNRDFFMSNMPETTNMNRVMFLEWFPQIVYNHHQPGFGSTGGVVFVPPFRDPFNYHFDPLLPLEVEQVGAAMNARLVARGMPGSGQRSFSNYSTWWNGGLRTITYFHNMVGLLTEIVGNPTPIEIPLVAGMQLPTNDLPAPVPPGPWHYRQAIDYDVQLNRAVMDYASRNRETLLYHMYHKGMNSIEAGSRDSWTVTPDRIAALAEAGAKLPQGASVRQGRAIPIELYESVLRDPAFRDPRGYVMPSSQADFATATRFVNALLKTGITVQKATSSFQVAGRSYPAGSYVVKTNQAFRPHVLDLFEPQNHPNDFAYPGGPPIPPYDQAGWTLAMQMGVAYDRIMDGFDGPFATVQGLLDPPAATVSGPANPAGWLVSHQENNSYIVANRLLKAGADVYWMGSEQRVDGKSLGTGAIWVPASGAARPILEKAAAELGVAAHGVARMPTGEALKLRPVRVGIYDQYGGLMPTGWTRWLCEQYEFPYELVYPRTLDAGNIKSRFDVLVFTDGAFDRGSGSGRATMGGAVEGAAAGDIPEPYRGWQGRITEDVTIPRIKEFVEAGGTVVAIGGSSTMGALLGVPVKDHLVEMGRDGKEIPLPGEKYYIPGSLLRANVNNADPLAYGMRGTVDVVFDNSPVFDLLPEAALKGTRPVAWFSGTKVLDSGWAWGQAYLDGGVAAVAAKVGAGSVALLGPEVAFRAQPHATFKLLFNGLLFGAAQPTRF
ncbi:MAG: M14 family metallopeptidase [Longimicrobiales bacterium]|nr:M14 family metallopeptidase [Longimicrobiales bacterium]